MKTPCRIWDGFRMHYLNDVQFELDEYVGVWLDDAAVLISRFDSRRNRRRFEPTSPWQLMHAVGQTDRHGTTMYDRDIVECEGRRWVVRLDAERCGYSLFLTYAIGLAPSVFLDRSLARSLTVIGNCLENPDLLLETFCQAA
ncbi:YopX family protein [Larkinella bovis]|uniref:YopX family protein n=1 Tax=Larkinella bovis TaxID=683041 RepID=A0ABW0I819_9BACT